MTTPTIDRAAALEVLAALREHEQQWQCDLAGLTDGHGEIRADRHSDYEHAKDEHGWRLLEQLPDWIARLAAALGQSAAEW